MASAKTQEQMLLDRYVLHEPIASGGMATVHLGQVKGARGFARTVAIKRLHPQFAKDPEFSSMLLDEARLAGAIRHPNVVPTLDVVQAEGELFMVMEYVAGESLSRLLQEARGKGARVPAPIGAAIVAGALAGLHAAHEARGEDGVDLQIVHRDISPHNILVGKDGSPRLVDFGIARAAVRVQVTRPGQIKGKLRYMAPEQLRGQRDLDRRVDIYAAGIVLWEVLTGEKLFDGESDAEVFGSVLEGVVTKPSALTALPAEIDQVVLRAVAREREDRFSTALEMAKALVAALPPASAAEVGAWVDALVGDVLAERAGWLAALEAPLDSAAPSSRGAQAPSSARGGPSSARGGPASAPGSGPRSMRTPIPSGATMTHTVTSPALSEVPQLKIPAPRAAAVEGAIIDTPTVDAAALEAPTPLAKRPRRAGFWIGGALALVLGALVATSIGRGRQEGAAPAPTKGAAETVSKGTEPQGAKDEAKGAPEEPAPPASAPAAKGAPEEPAPPASAPAAKAAPAKPAPPASASAASTGAASAPARPSQSKPRCQPPYYVDGSGIRRVKRECL